MLYKEKLEKAEIERGGMALIYHRDNGKKNLYVWINVNKFKCIDICIGYGHNNVLCYNLYKNYGYSGRNCLQYIIKTMDTSKFFDDEDEELFKEMLANPDLENCLDKCIDNIPFNLYEEEYRLIDEARKEYNEAIQKAIQAASDKYESEIRNIVNTRRNVEFVNAFTSRDKCGLSDSEEIQRHKR